MENSSDIKELNERRGEAAEELEASVDTSFGFGGPV